MKTTVEFRSDLSRAETVRALRVCVEAVGRLARRMTAVELQQVENLAAAIAALAENERAARGFRPAAMRLDDKRETTA